LSLDRTNYLRLTRGDADARDAGPTDNVIDTTL
jgi:hypothetical protein